MQDVTVIYGRQAALQDITTTFPEGAVGLLGPNGAGKSTLLKSLLGRGPTPTLDVSDGSYRLRLLNGSNSRIYKLAWSDGRPMIAIGSDGGLLAVPVVRPSHRTTCPWERIA